MASATAPRAAGTSLAPSPLPTSSASQSTTSTHEPELPYPSPSVENISGFPRINTGYSPGPPTGSSEFDTPAYPYPNSDQAPFPVSSPTSRSSEDPFAAQRGGAGTEKNPFTFEAKDGRENESGGEGAGEEEQRPERACEKTERKMSKESDTPKSPSTPSRSQNPRGRALVTPRSRDSHVEKDHEHDGEHHANFVEKGWARMTGKRNSRSEKE
ncbi:hypothetical protein BKA65DRAFT_237181 [Rhexocercosporidium sp. MPI-PUGE-AT-0058]|nr:hypothetical protein BKA65DRAFT_237181 [Rhexocercosporidium sp. MPI-PUGE-AT-0058]